MSCPLAGGRRYAQHPLRSPWRGAPVRRGRVPRDDVTATDMGALRRLASHSLVYGIAGMAGSLASFVLTPLYARCLGPEAYGHLETLLAVTQIITILAAGGAGSAALCLIIQPGGEAPAIGGSTAVAYAATTSLCLVIAWALTPWAAPVLHQPLGWLRLVSITGVLTAIAQLPTALWRARGRAWLLAGFSLAQVLVGLALAVDFVAVRGLGVAGILYGQMIVQALAVLSGVWLIRQALAERPKWETTWQVSSIGITHVANSLSTWTVQLSDRFFLAALTVGPSLGLYTLANKVAAVGQLALASPLALAWPSFLAHLARHPDARRQFGQISVALAAYAGGLFLFLALPAPWWVRWLGGPAYATAAPLVPMLAAAVVIAACQPVLISGFGLAMRFRTMPLIAAGGALLNVGLNAWAIPRYGAWGAAWTTLISYTVAAVSGRLVSQRLWPLPVPRRPLLGIGLWCLFLWLVGSHLPTLAERLAVVASYPVGIGAAWWVYRDRSTRLAWN